MVSRRNVLDKFILLIAQNFQAAAYFLQFNVYSLLIKDHKKLRHAPKTGLFKSL